MTTPAATIRLSNLHSQILTTAIDRINRVILGKDHQIKLVLACLIARGHVLIEDLPGVGKTTLAQTFAQVLGLDYQRIQFTSDLLPADVLGVSVYERNRGHFRFHPGPVFSQLILADEINRATPKTQSALLEAMEEQQVTIEGETRVLPQPFFVIATQNPTSQAGTYPLPESQLDRFLMRIQLGYPDHKAERQLLRGSDRRELIPSINPCLDGETLIEIQRVVAKVRVSDALLDYLQAILGYTRRADLYRQGLSPRAGVGLLRGAQAWAMLNAKDYVLPEDLQTVLTPVAAHRLQSLRGHPHSAQALIAQLIAEVPIP